MWINKYPWVTIRESIIYSYWLLLQKVCIFYTLLKRIFTLIYRFFLNVINVFVIYFHILINRQARFLLKSLKPIYRRITVWYREEWRKQLILKLPHIYIYLFEHKNLLVTSVFVPYLYYLWIISFSSLSFSICPKAEQSTFGTLRSSSFFTNKTHYICMFVYNLGQE